MQKNFHSNFIFIKSKFTYRREIIVIKNKKYRKVFEDS